MYLSVSLISSFYFYDDFSPFFSGKPDNVDVKVAGKLPLFEVLNIVTCLQIKIPLCIHLKVELYELIVCSCPSLSLIFDFEKRAWG